jgi:hypothetical protein
MTLEGKCVCARRAMQSINQLAQRDLRPGFVAGVSATVETLVGTMSEIQGFQAHFSGEYPCFPKGSHAFNGGVLGPKTTALGGVHRGP